MIKEWRPDTGDQRRKSERNEYTEGKFYIDRIRNESGCTKAKVDSSKQFKNRSLILLQKIK